MSICTAIDTTICTAVHTAIAKAIDAAINTIASEKASIGASHSRLESSASYMQEFQLATRAARSNIMDADMAAESTRLAQQNVLIQAGASMVVQANQQASLVLSLLQ